MSTTSNSTTTPRLTAREVTQYHENGYLIFKEPVLSPEKFTALKVYFEKILADLPANERPEAMDVPHFVHPQLLFRTLGVPAHRPHVAGTPRVRNSSLLISIQDSVLSMGWKPERLALPTMSP